MSRLSPPNLRHNCPHPLAERCPDVTQFSACPAKRPCRPVPCTGRGFSVAGLHEVTTVCEDARMPKAYWITTYRSIRDEQALAAYAKLATPAIQAGGGRFVARGLPARVYESGLNER